MLSWLIQMTKKFDKKLFEEFDNKGKETIRKYFEAKGFLVAYNPNQYTADMILLKPTTDGLFEKIALVEVGCRPSWKSHKFTFSDLRIESRKAKYLQDGLPVYFCVINQDFSSFVMLDEPLTNFPKIEVNNKFFPDKKESNFSIPASKLKFIELKNVDDIF